MLGTQRKIPELHTTGQSLTAKEQEEGEPLWRFLLLLFIFFFLTWKEWLQIQPKRINQLLCYREGPRVYKKQLKSDLQDDLF